MLEIFLFVCIVLFIAFFFSPYELTIGEDED
jgi:hypothetical protein